MAKPNHHSLAYTQQAQPNKTYKDLKQKQKAKIADWMYRETLRFYLTNSRMPDEAECEQICRCIFRKIEGVAIWVPYEDIKSVFMTRQEKYTERVLADIKNGITLEHLEKPKKPPKSERVRQRKPKKKKKSKENHEEPWQDDRFFFIAGYTSGGAPYGVTWEEMGLEPYQSLEDSEEDEIE